MSAKRGLRILVNAINDNAELRGPDRYLLGLLASMSRQAPEFEFLLCHAPWQRAISTEPLCQNVARLQLQPPRGRLGRLIWHASAFPRWADQQRADAVFLPNIFLMPTLQTPCVMTVHDLAHFRVPEKFGRLKGRVQRLQIRRAVKTPKALIAVSEFTKRDLIGFLGVEPSRIQVIAEGGPSPMARSTRTPQTPFLLYVGRVERSKNVEGLIEAFIDSDILRRMKARLVIVGSAGNAEADVRRLIAACADQRVERRGFVSEEALKELYSTCSCFVFPSLAEGFGLVLLEAMAYGAPIIAMNATAVPEVVGDAGILIDPEQPDGLRNAMEKVTVDAALRADLSQRGYDRLRQFSWDQAAQRTLKILSGVAS